MRSVLTRRAIYPLYEALSGRQILAKLQEIEEYQWRSRAELEALQFRRLSQLLSYAYENVPFYRRAFDDRDVSPDSVDSLEAFRHLPILRRETVQVYGKELVSRAYSSDRLISNRTGGSTGKPVEFYQDRVQQDLGAAAKLCTNRWAGWEFGKRMQCVWGHRGDVAATKRLWGRLRGLALNEHTCDSYHLTEAAMAELAQRLNVKPAQVILGPSSTLYRFASYLERSGVTVPAPDGIIASVEMLFPAERAVIERILGARVFNRYACREVSLIAAECPEHTGMHVDITRLVVEVVNDAGDPCQTGELGHILITDLFNYAMPLIRYRIEDMGVLSDEACKCGRGLPLLAEISGREKDLLRTATGDPIRSSSLSLLPGIPGLVQAQLVQERLDLLVVRLVTREGYDSASEAKLRERLRKHFGPGMEFRFDYVEAIPILPSGKFRFSVSRLGDDQAQE